MKIYILPVDEKYFKIPRINPFCPHSQGFNCELDFHRFIKEYPDLTNNPDEATWHYLPMYWSYWQLSNDYGRVGRKEMNEYLKKLIISPEKTFTVSEADNEPRFETKIKVFSANTYNEDWITIPEMTLPHAFPEVLPERKYLTSFVGSFKTHPIRPAMQKALRLKKDVLINRSEHTKEEKLFVKTILESYSTLCPRGSAMASYRFWESMQLGVCPIMVSEVDMRPFKDEINWDQFSYWVDNVNKLPDLLDTLDKEDLIRRGKMAQHAWNVLFNQGWCKYMFDYL